MDLSWRPTLKDSSVRRFGKGSFDPANRVAVMAVINRTPDSFHDRGATFSLDRAVAAAEAAVAAGADWVDVGGVPFGRGPEVSEAEELDRVVPLVAEIANRTDAVISVDTTRAAVARAAVAAGAGVINDTSGFYDPAMPAAVADTGAGVVLTHSLHPPRSEPPRPVYDDVVSAVLDHLSSAIDVAIAAGVQPDRILVDPGHDLNKNTRHSLELSRRLPEITGLGYPVLVALSNKDFIGETLDRPQQERVIGSVTAAALAVVAGARVVRVHDVAATVDAVRMAEAIVGLREPAYVLHNNGST